MIYEYPYYIEEIRESQCRPDVLWGRTEIMESRKSKTRQILLKARGEEENQCRPDVLWGRTEIMKSRKSKSREISLKARGRKKDNVSLTVLGESREKREWKSRVGQISLKARG